MHISELPKTQKMNKGFKKNFMAREKDMARVFKASAEVFKKYKLKRFNITL